MELSLYDISQELMNALNEEIVNEETGEITYSPNLDALTLAFDKKVDGISCYVKNLNSYIDAVKAEEDKLKQKRESAEKRVEWLKQYLQRTFESLELKEWQSSKNTISFRKSVSVNITDETSLPANYIIIKQTSQPDKMAIKKALTNGELVNGAELVEKQNIQIK